MCLADTFHKSYLMGVCITHPICGAGGATHRDQDYLIVMGDKRLGIRTKFVIIEEMQIRRMLLFLPSLGWFCGYSSGSKGRISKRWE